jgi:hypothetical protein
VAAPEPPRGWLPGLSTVPQGSYASRVAGDRLDVLLKLGAALIVVPAVLLIAIGFRGPGLIGGALLLVLIARTFYRSRADKLRERLITMSGEEASRVGRYSARCPRCGRERLYDMEKDERIYPENAFEYAGRQVFCGRCFFEGRLEPYR